MLAVLSDLDLGEMRLLGNALVYVHLTISDRDAPDHDVIDLSVREMARWLRSSPATAARLVGQLVESRVLIVDTKDPVAGRGTAPRRYRFNNDSTRWRLPVLVDRRQRAKRRQLPADVRQHVEIDHLDEFHVSRVTAWRTPPEQREDDLARAPGRTRRVVARGPGARANEVQRAAHERALMPKRPATARAPEARASDAPLLSVGREDLSLSREGREGGSIDHAAAKRVFGHVAARVALELDDRGPFLLANSRDGDPAKAYWERFALVVSRWLAAGEDEERLVGLFVRRASAFDSNVEVLGAVETIVDAHLEALAARAAAAASRPEPRSIEILEEKPAPPRLDDETRANGRQHLAGARSRLVPSPTPEEGAA